MINNMEKSQVYFAIALLICGWHTEISGFISVSAGLFLGCATFFFWEAWK